LHPGLREFKVVRLKGGKAKVKMSEKDDLILFGSPHWGELIERYKCGTQ
jgi:hypothetical protein